MVIRIKNAVRTKNPSLDQSQRLLSAGANSILHLQKFVPAKMDQTLEENGIVDDDLAFEKLGIDDDGYMPVLHIYFNDDLTIA